MAKKRHHRRKKQRSFPWLNSVAVLIALVCAGILWYCLEHYEPHAEVEVISVYTSILGILADGFIIAVSIYRRHTLQLVFGLGSLAVCASILCVAWSIPLCPQCQNLTPADLGLLAHWISAAP